jgi:two-component system sensor histidine kinase and response regulator WspE
MKPPGRDQPNRLSMLELFRVEAENQTAVLTAGLLELERGSPSPALFETLMRAAHSLKGAARIVNLRPAEKLAHALEDCFVALQQGKVSPRQLQTDVLLRGVDLLADFAKRPEAGADAQVINFTAQIQHLLASASGRPPVPERAASAPGPGPETETKPAEPSPAEDHGFVPLEEIPGWLPAQTGAHPSARASVESAAQALALRKHEPAERYLRLTAERLNRLLGLAGESLVESRWLRPFADSLQRLKRHQTDLAQEVEHLREGLEADRLSERSRSCFNELLLQLGSSRQYLADRMQELDLFERRFAQLSQRLYLEVLRTRMRPFSDGVRRFPRMVRDLARALGKEVRLEIHGETTQVDRDILERLETPLAHLVRNAVDHGCETPDERHRAGKPPEMTLRIEARHSAGVLLVAVSDDGAGVPLERVRRAISERELAAPAKAEALSEAELLEYLFLPGFTLKETVTEISGRGVGLDVVQNMVKAVRGGIRLGNQAGRGFRVQLQLPLTLSVLRALLVEVAGEPYAVPLTQITRALKVARAGIQTLEGRHHFAMDGQQVGLLSARQVLECGESAPAADDLPVLVLSDRNSRVGLAVDRFLGERELVVQPLDPRLGKVRDISSAALMEDGAPVLIIDVDDVLRSIDDLIARGQPSGFRRAGFEMSARKRKRILAVDDSLTVRELERKLLAGSGYLIDVAVDGAEAWNLLGCAHYDLLITDVDMPRLNGVELAGLVKKDPRFKSLPVLIVSYKDRPADRLRGLEAGADYYLTKEEFHDETLLQAVTDLIGESET